MRSRGSSKAGWWAVAGAAWLWCAGCASVPPAAAVPAAPAPDETAAVLGMVRQEGWQEVLDLLPALDEQPETDYPGVAALTRQLNALAASTPGGHGVPAFALGRLVDHNPDFWRAYFEIAPGDPLTAMLHVGLLLAAGEAARADVLATLAIDFGRMNLDYRKELVRLDAYAQLLRQGGQPAATEGRRREGPSEFAALAVQAQAMLRTWPQNPAALADLVRARWGLAGKPGRLAPDSPAGSSLAALRATDPFYVLPPEVAGPEPPAAAMAQRLWRQIDEDQAIGDDQVLTQFSAAAQAAGLDEIALTARSLLSGRNTGMAPLDEAFVRRSLERLVGAPAGAAICTESFTQDRDWVGFGSENDAPPSDLEGVTVHPQLEQRLLVLIAETSYWIESGLLQGADLAANYAQRGEAWAQMLQQGEAVADLRRAMALDPADNRLRYSLAVTLSDGGDYREADELFAEAAKQAPRDAGETQSWGNHLFKQGRFAEAEAAYAQAARLDPNFAYAQLMRRLAQIRQGKPGSVHPTSRMAKEDPWAASLLAFVGGRIDRKALFGRLEPQGGLRYSEEECELYFVLAELALARGDVADARRNLHSCLGTGITDFVEYAMAWQELRRLDAAHPPPAEKKSQGGDADDEEPV
jgi:lipoprotein NlpI